MHPCAPGPLLRMGASVLRAIKIAIEIHSRVAMPVSYMRLHSMAVERYI